MNRSIRVVGCLIYMALSLPLSAWAQLPDLAGKRAGVYISMRQLSFTDAYYKAINQFLTVEEDRSWSELVKTEFALRIGERLSAQLQAITGADTVYFLNADPQRGRDFIQHYHQGQDSLAAFGGSLAPLQVVFSLSALDFKTRSERIAYIRSNRIISEQLSVRQARMGLSIFRPQGQVQRYTTCYDERSSGKPPMLMDFFAANSPLGAYLSQLFSVWWLQLSNEEKTNCR